MRAIRAWHSLLIGVLSCSPGSGLTEQAPRVVGPAALRVTTDRSSYAVGDALTVRFLNVSESSVFLNRCDGVLERRSAAGQWLAIMPAAGDVPCRDILEGLAPGAFFTRPFDLATSLEAGMYRFRFKTALDSRQQLLPESSRVTNVFTVR